MPKTATPSHDNHPFHFTAANGKRDVWDLTPYDDKDCTWGEFVASVTKSRVREEKDGPCWIPALFGTKHNPRSDRKRDGKTGLRWDGNVRRITAVVLDIDGDETTYTEEQLKERLVGLEYVCHTTYSSTPENPSWRVILPLKKRIPARKIKAAFAAVHHLTGLECDPKCHHPACVYYAPACPGAGLPHFRCFRGRGSLLSLPKNPPVNTPSKPPIALPRKPPNSKGIGQNKPITNSKNVGNGFSAPDLTALADPAVMLELGRLKEAWKAAELALPVARGLGLPLDKLNAGGFLSILPWRKEKHPSCCLLMAPGEPLVLHDSGDRNGCTYSLDQYAIVKVTGKPLARRGGPEQFTWQLKLLAEARLLALPEVPDLPPCPEDAPRRFKDVYEGIKLLLRCRARVGKWAGEPTMMAKGFLATWCGVSEGVADRARRWLTERGIIHICGKFQGRTCLYRPGPVPYLGKKGQRRRWKEAEKYLNDTKFKAVFGAALVLANLTVAELEELSRDRRLPSKARYLLGSYLMRASNPPLVREEEDNGKQRGSRPGGEARGGAGGAGVPADGKRRAASGKQAAGGGSGGVLESGEGTGVDGTGAGGGGRGVPAQGGPVPAPEAAPPSASSGGGGKAPKGKHPAAPPDGGAGRRGERRPAVLREAQGGSTGKGADPLPGVGNGERQAPRQEAAGGGGGGAASARRPRVPDGVPEVGADPCKVDNRRGNRRPRGRAAAAGAATGAGRGRG